MDVSKITSKPVALHQPKAKPSVPAKTEGKDSAIPVNPNPTKSVQVKQPEKIQYLDPKEMRRDDRLVHVDSQDRNVNFGEEVTKIRKKAKLPPVRLDLLHRIQASNKSGTKTAGISPLLPNTPHQTGNPGASLDVIG